MGISKPVGGYGNPAYGVWATALAIQSVIVFLLLELGDLKGVGFNKKLIEDLTAQQSLDNIIEEFGKDSRKLCLALGAVHALLFVINSVLVLLGYLVSECFVFPCFAVAFVQEIVMMCTGGIIGYKTQLLNEKVQMSLDRFFGDARMLLVPATESLSSEDAFFVLNRGSLIVVACASIAIMPFFFKALGQKPNTPSSDSMLFLPTVALCLFVGTFFAIIGARKVTYVPVFAALYYIVGIALSFFVSLQKCVCERVFSIVNAVFFILTALLCIVTTWVFSFCFYVTREVMYLYVFGTQSQLLKGREEIGKFEKAYSVGFFFDSGATVVGGNPAQGSYIVAITSVLAVLVCYAVFSSIYSIRSVIGPTRNNTVSDEKEAEQTTSQVEAKA